MEDKKIAIIAVLIVIFIVLCGICIYGFLNQNTEVLEINDINIKQDEFGIFKLEGHITPLKDFNYLDARIVFYDEDGTIIGKAPCAWNMIDIKKGSTISLGDSLGGVCDGTPSYAVVEFYDSVTANTPIANATIKFTVDNDTSSDDNSGSVSVTNNDNSNKDNDKKFTQKDLDRARDEGYSEGYIDSYQDSYDDYYTDDYYSESGQSESVVSSSSQVETTTDSGWY